MKRTIENINAESNFKPSSIRSIYRYEKNSKIGYWVLGIFVFLLIVLLLPWTQNISSSGHVTTLYQDQRPQQINTVIPGKIIKWYIKEGDVVKKGDTLVQLADTKDDYLDSNLVERTKEALDRAIQAVAPGRPINVIGRVIESYAKRFNYGVVRDFTGHGVHTSFHSGLVIPHFDDPTATQLMQEGMTFTIEPMLNLGTHDYDILDDTWTVLTKDRKMSAQFEHTLVIGEDGAEVLTRREGER